MKNVRGVKIRSKGPVERVCILTYTAPADRILLRKQAHPLNQSASRSRTVERARRQVASGNDLERLMIVSSSDHFTQVEKYIHTVRGSESRRPTNRGGR